MTRDGRPRSPARDDWDTHWRHYAHTAALNPAQDYRRTLILSLLGLPGRGAGARILDIGSGQGDMAAAVHARFAEARIMGLELNQAGVEISRQKVPGARFVQRNLLEPFQPSAEDAGWATHAICSEVLEHLDDPALLLRNAAAYMQPGCRLIVTVPGGPMSAFDRHIGHRKHYKPPELRTVLRAAGFDVRRAFGAGFPFFNLYRLVIVSRGASLQDDVRGQPSPPLRLALLVFHVLFRFNVARWGWQTAGVAHYAGERQPVNQ